MTGHIEESGLELMIATLGRVDRDISGPGHARLERIARHAFSDVQSKIHVVSGELRRSATVRTEWHNGQFTVTLVVGDGLDYADLEMARGGTHDFFRNVPDYENQLDQASDEVLGW